MSRYHEQVDLLYHQELGGLEMVNAQYRHKNFAKHCHETYTVSVIESGGQKFFRSNYIHFAPEHSIILINADDVHTGRASNGVGWSYQAIYPLESHFTKLADDLGWQQGFAPYFPNAVVFDPQMACELRQLFACLQYQSNSLLRETMLNSVLTKLMVKHGKTKKHIKPIPENKIAIYKVKEYLDSHATDNISLEYLASRFGVSAFHLVRLFQRQFGLPPHAYQIQQRLKQAKSLLKKGYSVVDTSTSLGFHDQSHFHRHFKKVLGITPGKYAKIVS
ncbi:helix-turn-helix domain-containing protein [Colwelliaceae bacterium 6441]